jgi:hypothetical protein
MSSLVLCQEFRSLRAIRLTYGFSDPLAAQTAINARNNRRGRKRHIHQPTATREPGCRPAQVERSSPDKLKRVLH